MFADQLRQLFKFRFVVYNLVSSNLRARYRRSILGFFWSLLNPLITMVILALVFSSLYRLPISDFGLYIFSGLLPWQLISNSIINASSSIINAESFLKKVNIPANIFPIVSIGIETLNFFFSFLGLSIIALIFGFRWSLASLFLPIALLLTVLFILGLALIVSTVSVFFRDLTHILSISLMGFFYLTPIVYQKSLLPSDAQIWLLANPFYYFIEMFHQILHQAKNPDAEIWLACLLIALCSSIAGFMIFTKKEKDLIYRL